METALISKTKLADEVWEFCFKKPPAFTFEAGDYVSLGITNVAARWLSMASHPDEKDLLFTVKIPDTSPSYFKQAFMKLVPGDSCVMSPAIGNFNLPRDDSKILFVAFGIGVTPYRAMLGGHVKNPGHITLLYAAKPGQHIHEDVIKKSGVHYIKREQRFDLTELAKLVPDYKERIIFIAGPEIACQSLYAALLHDGMPRMQLKLEYFTGYLR